MRLRTCAFRSRTELYFKASLRFTRIDFLGLPLHYVRAGTWENIVFINTITRSWCGSACSEFMTGVRCCTYTRPGDRQFLPKIRSAGTFVRR